MADRQIREGIRLLLATGDMSGISDEQIAALHKLCIQAYTERQLTPKKVLLALDELEAIKSGRAIQAIKLIRHRTNMNLKDCKTLYDKWCEENGKHKWPLHRGQKRI